MRKFVLLAFATLAACGPTSEEKQQAKAQVEKDITQADAQAACNAKGRFYNLGKHECMDDVFVAAWTCTRAGWDERVAEKEVELNEEELSDLEREIAAGYSFHQCGEAFKGAEALFAFTLLKSWIDGDSARASAQTTAVTGTMPSE